MQAVQHKTGSPFKGLSLERGCLRCILLTKNPPGECFHNSATLAFRGDSSYCLRGPQKQLAPSMWYCFSSVKKCKSYRMKRKPQERRHCVAVLDFLQGVPGRAVCEATGGLRYARDSITLEMPTKRSYRD